MQCIADRGVLRAVDQVGHFKRIGLQVVKLVCGHQIDHQLIPSVKNTADRLKAHKAVVIHLIARVLDMHIAPRRLQIDGLQSLARKRFRLLHPKILQNRGHHINVRHGRLADALLKISAGNQQRDVGNFVIHHAALAQKPVRKKHVAVVGRVNDHGLYAERIDLIKHAAKLVITKGIAGKHGALNMPKPEKRHVSVFFTPDLLVHGLIFQTCAYIRIAFQTEAVASKRTEEAPRTNAWVVRFIQRDGQEEIAVAVLLQKADRPIAAAVRKSILLFRVIPAAVHILTALPARAVIRQFVKEVAHIVPIPFVKPVGTFAVTEIVAAVQMPFADVAARDPALGEQLPNVRNTAAQRHAVCLHPVGMRIKPRKQRRACGTANRLAGKGVFKTQAVFSKRI